MVTGGLASAAYAPSIRRYKSLPIVDIWLTKLVGCKRNISSATYGVRIELHRREVW